MKLIESDSLSTVSRRTLLVAGAVSAAALITTGCKTVHEAATPSASVVLADHEVMYGPLPDEQFPVPAVKLKRVDPRFYRKEVDYESDEPKGTVIVNTETFYLYLIGENGRAMRYGVGLGRAGFEWFGRGRIAWKRKWPTWTPPDEMIERQPELARWSAANGGMEPGLKNPLGARALYIFKDGKDTLYRLHGTIEARSIGKSVSSGCVRLLSQDVIDLFDRSTPNAAILVV
jgi:lipoprotein-anchoring transpeptidase ErfK/SrfK